MVGSVRSSVIKAPPPNVNVMESSCGGWTRGSAEGAFFLTLAGLFRVGASTGVHECFSKRPRLKLSFSAPRTQQCPAADEHVESCGASGEVPIVKHQPKGVGQANQTT